MKIDSPVIGWLMLLALFTLDLQLSTALAQGTAFTYQGRLNAGGNAASGLYDLSFALYDAASGGAQHGATVGATGVPVTNGLFTVTLDFGSQFGGGPLWLDISVRTNGVGTYTGLSPRQALTPAPYAIMANNAHNLLGTLPAAQLSGAIQASQVSGTVSTAATLTGPLAGDVTGTQSATVVSSVGGQTAANVAAGASAANAATSANTASTLVKRDAAGSFSAGTLTLAGNLNLPWTGAGAGIIYAGGSPLIQSYSSGNFFAGPNAGNVTMSGTGNLGVGANALSSDTSGYWNTAVGNGALQYDGVGYGNTALGVSALVANTSGEWNTASGLNALEGNTTGVENTATGTGALANNPGSSQNTADGAWALLALTNGNGNLALGQHAGINLTSGNNNIYIGNYGATSESGVIRLGTPGTHTTTLLAGNVGIGTGSPWAKLDVHVANGTLDGLIVDADDGRWTGLLPTLTQNTYNPLTQNGDQGIIYGGGTIGHNGGFVIAPWVSSNLGLRIDTNGNVGIGTSAPGARLTAWGGNLGTNAGDTVSTADLFALSGNDDQFRVEARRNTAGADWSTTDLFLRRVVDVTPISYVRFGQWSVSLGTSTNADHLTVLNNGNVGIGTASPATALDVNGTVTATAFSGNGGGLTGISGSQIAGGDLAVARLNVGSGNTLGGTYATIAGGQNNTATYIYATVGGGLQNIAIAQSATVGGGQFNYAGDWATTIGGGSQNSATGTGATVAGGGHNVVSNSYATVVGGYGNTVGSFGSFIGAGWGNTIQSNSMYATIAGGCSNMIYASNLPPYDARYATIGGGWGNIASGPGATVAGGGIDFKHGTVAPNQATGNGSFIGGGAGNTASFWGATVVGGEHNTASGRDATIGGGVGNSANGPNATVGGGENNLASGYDATVPGGVYNYAGGNDSFAAGKRAKANHDGAFVWGDNTDADISSSGVNQFIIRATGGIYINDTDLHLRNDVYHGIGWYGASKLFAGVNVNGPVLYGGDGGCLGSLNGSQAIALQWTPSSVTVNGTFNNNSDRNAKQDFAPVEPGEILEKVARLPLSEWSYKNDPTTRHIGPMAQDFHAAFDVGTDEKHIAPIDEGGVTLAAIQGLNQKLEQKETEITELRQRLEQLERLIKHELNRDAQ